MRAAELNRLSPGQMAEALTGADARDVLGSAEAERLSVDALRSLVRLAGWAPRGLSGMRRHEILEFVRRGGAGGDAGGG